MPRIDPVKLLSCLSVLLAPNGGILSANEVKRLANLMAKFSKKLVSKCIYIQILKCTETELLGQFMAAGGWSLTYMWLSDGVATKNWPLIQELLELLLCCPVDVERLKSNTAPKLVKSLSKDSSHEGVRLLASKLVEQWLKIARNDVRTTENQVVPSNASEDKTSDASLDNSSSLHDTLNNKEDDVIEDDLPVENGTVGNGVEQVNNSVIASDNSKSNKSIKSNDVEKDQKEALVFKISVKNGKQIVAKVESPVKGPNEIAEETSDSEKNKDNDIVETLNDKEVKEKASEKAKEKDKKEKDKERSSSSDKDRRKSLDKDKSKEREKDKDKKSTSSSQRSSSNKSSSSSSKSSSHGKSSSSSSSSSRHKSSSSSSKSSSSRDKDKNSSSSSSSSSKRRSSSTSSKHSSSSSSKDKPKENKDKDPKESEKDRELQSDKDKDTLSKVLPPSISKIGKIPKKVKDDEDESNSSTSSKTTDKNSSSLKKASISIEVRNSEHRPKTVKTFHSQFRSHGLAEEAPPPPSRKTLKKPTTTPTAVIGSTAVGTISLKRSSPPPQSASKEGPPEKKIKEELPDKPGAIKLIPAKRQPSLVESDMFMDALSATLSTKKELRKRKRKLSASENVKSDKPSSGGDKTPPASPTPSSAPSTPTVETPPIIVNKVVAAPLKFYQDTLDDNQEDAKKDEIEPENTEEIEKVDDKNETVEDKEEVKEEVKAEEIDSDDEIIRMPKRMKSVLNDDKEEEKDSLIDAVGDDVMKKMAAEDDKAEKDSKKSESNETESEKKVPGPGCGPNGPPGVLVIHRRKGPKKQLKWKPQDILEEVRFFELDETERINVTKTFMDMKQMERTDERKQFLMARKLQSEDIMMERTAWLPLMLVDNVPPAPEGMLSQERQIQTEREKNILQALYFSKNMIPESPQEPDLEIYSVLTDPQTIPLEDVMGNPDAVNDFTNMPWPERKGTPPHEASAFNTSLFPLAPGGFPPFGPPGNWNMPPNNAPMQMGGFNPMGPMPDQIMPMPQMNMNGPQMGMNGISMSINIPPMFNNSSFSQPARDEMRMKNSSNRSGGGGGYRGSSQNNGGWFRGDSGRDGPAGHWNRDDDRPNIRSNRNNFRAQNWSGNNNRGGNGRPICKQWQMKGFCRSGDKCNYAHINF